MPMVTHGRFKRQQFLSCLFFLFQLFKDDVVGGFQNWKTLSDCHQPSSHTCRQSSSNERIYPHFPSPNQHLNNVPYNNPGNSFFLPPRRIARRFFASSSSTTDDDHMISDDTTNGRTNDEDYVNGVSLSTKEPTTQNINTTIARTSETNSRWPYWTTASELTQAGTVGATIGFLVAVFKLSIEAVRSVCYEQDIWVIYPKLLFLIPTIGGIIVGLLLWLGGPYPPGLRGTVQEVDEEQNKNMSDKQDIQNVLEQFKVQGNFLRKSTAAVITLGTGCSLGPEGPCVEIGMNVARASLELTNNAAIQSSETMSQPEQFQLQQKQEQQRNWSRVLLSAGAAAGVAAGFNAPIAGVFFALEIMQNAFQSIDDQNQATIATISESGGETDGNASTISQQTATPSSTSVITTNTSITPILIASVLSALVSRGILGNHLIFKVSQGFSAQTPLIELPLYLILGAMSGLVAFTFTYTAKISQSAFAGEWGPDPVKQSMKSLPDPFKPVIGGLLCGLAGLAFPQILFFGYETLNPLMKSQAYLPITVILSLLAVKTLMTAVCAGSGLVGGTFAPSLFLGTMTGAAFRNGAGRVIQNLKEIGLSADLAIDGSDPSLSSSLFSTFPTSLIHYIPLNQLHLASVPAYAMVGAASVLAALFRAPLTATLLLFEVTRNYDVLLPIMASAGVASIVSDILEDTLERRDEMQRRDKDPVSWGVLSDDNNEEYLDVSMGPPSLYFAQEEDPKN